MGGEFCNNVREIKYYFNIWGIRKKKKEGGSEKKGGLKIYPFHLPWIRAWKGDAADVVRSRMIGFPTR